MIVVITLALLMEQSLSSIILDDFLRIPLVILISFGLHSFLSTSLLDHYQTQEKNLKNIVNETLHELNTPISTIEANLKMLQKSHSDDKTQKRLTRIQEASKNLSRLYESIEHSIKSEIDSVEKELFDLRAIIQESIDNFLDIKRDITIENLTPSLMLFGDKNGFYTCMDNLLSNAIKYNKKNGFVKFFFCDGILKIEDSGIGIDTKNLFIVFDKAYQENPSTKGYGIGLSIVKSYCDREKIEIKIDTKKDIGTIIMMDLTILIAS